MRPRTMALFAAIGIALGLGAALHATVATVDETQALDRTVLPIPQPPAPRITELDVRNVKPPKRFDVKAPEKAPNVLVVLIDDMGFGQSSAFGGPIHMPTAERLAGQGLKYNKFHTTALCSPSRAALLTGRNHHVCNMGSITETATAYPGQTGERPDSVAPLAEMLRLNGFATAAFGKSHETAAWEVSVSGPTNRWPTRSGFDKFYGFIGGEANQWAPTLYDGLTQVKLPKDPNYHLLPDMTNQAIAWVQGLKALTPEKPFFVYFAPGATHAPHHAPKSWIDKYKGKFDMGWDQLREQTLARQKRLGVVPQDTQLAPKPPAIKDWANLSADERKLFAREMEVFAGYGEFADHQVGRLVDAIDALGQLENTLVFYIIGDNGASAEGGMNGLFNEMAYFNLVHESVDDILKHYDDLGGPRSYGHYAAGWAVAGDTPFTWTKQVASNYGGTRNGMIISWPKRIKAKGEVRSQWHHMIDIAPTILEASGLPEPKSVNGTPQTPMDGVGMVYTFDNPSAKDRHTTQYFEIFCNRAIYHDGWLAGTLHRAPWEPAPRAKLAADAWELYDTRNDFSLRTNLAQKAPEKLKELQALFLEEAVKNHVLPLDDRTTERFLAETAGRPDLMMGKTSLTVYEGMTGMTENVFISVKNKSHAITADLVVPEIGCEGVLVCQAGAFGGWSLYLKAGKPTYVYNFLGLEEFKIASPESVPKGKVRVRLDFAYDGGKPNAGATGALSINGKKVAQGRIEKTQSLFFSADEGADVGVDEGTPVTPDYPKPDNAFTGKIEKITIDLKP